MNRLTALHSSFSVHCSLFTVCLSTFWSFSMNPLFLIPIIGIGAYFGLPRLLQRAGLHPHYEGRRFNHAGKRALIVMTSQDTRTKSGKATKTTLAPKTPRPSAPPAPEDVVTPSSFMSLLEEIEANPHAIPPCFLE